MSATGVVTAADPASGRPPSRPGHALSLRAHLPVLVALATYLAVSLALVGISIGMAGGHFIYALDDPYINMAMAKNIALHGQWGITPFGFSSSTSSPLFVLLLAGLNLVFGARALLPLVLSLGFGLAAIVVAETMLRAALGSAARTMALLAMVLLTPMFVIGTLGMEHSLHLLLTLLFLRELQRGRPDSSLWRLAAITALMCGTRYEGLLLAAPAVALLLLRGAFRRAITLALAAAVPVLSYAAWSLAHGAYWLPNSVALKGFHVMGLGLTARLLVMADVFLGNCFDAPYVCLLIILLLVVRVALRKTRDRGKLLALDVLAAGALLHLLLASVGWAYRYEDYLLGSMIVLTAGALAKLPRPYAWPVRGAYLLAGLATANLTLRAVEAAELLPHLSQAIYRQQWQTAEFFHRYYPGASIAANDIGAINFRTDLHCIDLTGLANHEIFAAKQTGTYTTQRLVDVTSAANVRVAAVYDVWFTGVNNADARGPLFGPALPKQWVRVARWTIPKTEGMGGETVSFYAVQPREEETLRANLRAFQPLLPPVVTVTPD